MSNVNVYSSSTCSYCVLVKNLLKSQNVEYNEISVENNPELVQKLLSSSGQMGIPQTEINGNWVVGYKPNEIKKLLERTIEHTEGRQEM
jgi:glutaredoxin 3